MTKQFNPDEALTAALDSVAGRLEHHETRVLRAGLAARYRMLAEAYDIARASAATAQQAAREASRQAAQHSAQHSAQRLFLPGQSTDLAFRAVRAELATVLHVSERTIERQLSNAYTLTHDFPTVLDSLAAGVIGDAHTKVITLAGAVIGCGDDPDVVARRAAYTAAVLAFAVNLTPAQLRPIAERLAEQFSERTIDERHEEAKLGRMVCVRDLCDGMSELLAVLPSAEAHAIHDRLTRMAKQQELVEAAARVQEAASTPSLSGVHTEPTAWVSRDHRRADLFSDLLLTAHPENHPEAAAVRAIVHVTITDETLFAPTLRLAESVVLPGGVTSLAPAELAGCGGIPTSAARALASSVNTWRLVHHDAYTGDVIRVEQYSPTLEQRQFLAARDQHCRFPGCRAVAHRCDIDHTHDHALGGNTSTDNLAHLCRGHHMLKHHGGWSVKQKPAGVLEWRSPTGRVYKDRPPSRVRFEATARPGATTPSVPEPPCEF